MNISRSNESSITIQSINYKIPGIFRMHIRSFHLTLLSWGGKNVLLVSQEDVIIFSLLLRIKGARDPITGCITQIHGEPNSASQRPVLIGTRHLLESLKCGPIGLLVRHPSCLPRIFKSRVTLEFHVCKIKHPQTVRRNDQTKSLLLLQIASISHFKFLPFNCFLMGRKKSYQFPGRTFFNNLVRTSQSPSVGDQQALTDTFYHEDPDNDQGFSHHSWNHAFESHQAFLPSMLPIPQCDEDHSRNSAAKQDDTSYCSNS